MSHKDSGSSPAFVGHAVAVTALDGGDWLQPGEAKLIHSIIFSGNWRWDAWNGWRPVSPREVENARAAAFPRRLRLGTRVTNLPDRTRISIYDEDQHAASTVTDFEIEHPPTNPLADALDRARAHTAGLGDDVRVIAWALIVSEIGRIYAKS